MKKKSLICLLVAVVMIVSMFSGCAKAPADAPTADTPVEGTPAEQDLPYVELDWYTNLANYDSVEDMEMIQNAVNDYLLEKLNCTVDFHVNVNYNYGEEVSLALSSGENVDLMYVGGDNDYNTVLEMGGMYPLNELLEKYGQNAYNTFAEEVWGCVSKNGDIYMVPTLRDNAYFLGVLYNEDLLNELGLDITELGTNSLIDMEEFAMKALERRNELHPEWANMPLCEYIGVISPYFLASESFIANQLAMCNIPNREANLSAGEDEVFNYYESEHFRSYCLMMQRLVEAGVFAYDESIGASLMSEPSTLMSHEWGYVAVPEHMFSEDWVTKVYSFDPWLDASGYTVAGLAIGANSQNPERAMMLIDLLNSDTTLATMLRFGIEGVHWQRNDDGTISTYDRNSDPSNMGWKQWYGVQFGNITLAEVPVDFEPEAEYVFEQLNLANAEADMAVHMGFVFDTTPVVNEIAACDNVLAQYMYLMKGQVDSEETVNLLVDELIDMLKANGSDVVVAEAQRQLDEWIAANR